MNTDSLNTVTSTRARLLEVSTFVFLILPSLILSFFGNAPIHSGHFAQSATAVMLQDLALVCLVLLFTWRDGESFHALGWRVSNASQNITLGVLLWVGILFGMGILQNLFSDMGIPSGSKTLPSAMEPASTTDFILAAILVFIVAVSEETIFRGYLLLRFKQVSGNTAFALVLSSVIFAIGHGYEGIMAVFIIGSMGFVFGLVYLWRKSLVAPITMHFMQDFMALVIIPLWSSGHSGSY